VNPVVAFCITGNKLYPIRVGSVTCIGLHLNDINIFRETERFLDYKFSGEIEKIFLLEGEFFVISALTPNGEWGSETGPLAQLLQGD
jgi:hypothetical protein